MKSIEKSLEGLWLVIPTANRHQYLVDIFDASGIPEERRILIRTEEGTDITGAINITAPVTFNIQAWWNQGIDFAKSHGAEFVAVLNDDTKLSQGDLEILIEKLIADDSDLVHPDPTHTGGWGHCFILRLDSSIRPDERFTWWCGDHDLAMQAKKSRGLSIADISIENLHSNEYTSQNQRMKKIITEDIRAFRRKYPFYTLSHELLPRLLRKIIRVMRSR